MKRIFISLAVIVALFVGALYVASVYYQEPLRAFIEAEVEKQLDADIQIASIELSLLKAFPEATVSIKEVRVNPVKTQSNQNISSIDWFSFNVFEVQIKPLAYLFDNVIHVSSVELEGIHMLAWLDQEGTLSFEKLLKMDQNLSNKVEQESEADSLQTKAFNLQVESYRIQIENLIFIDSTTNIDVQLSQFQHSGSFSYSSDEITFNNESAWNDLSISANEVTWVNNLSGKLALNGSYLPEKEKLHLNKSNILWGSFPLELQSTIDLSTPMKLAVNINAPASNLAELIALIPTEQRAVFDPYDANGQFAFEATIDGTLDLDNEVYPAFNAIMQINDGSLKMAEEYGSIDSINMSLIAQKDEGAIEGLDVHLERFSAQVGDGNIRSEIRLAQFFSNPSLTGNISANLKLENFRSLASTWVEDLSGQLSTNLRFDFKADELEQMNFNDRSVNGNFLLKNVSVASEAIPAKLSDLHLDLNFAPNSLILEQFDGQFGASDWKASGKLNGLLDYLYTDGSILSADLSLSSRRVDLDELSSLFSDTTETELAVIPLPNTIKVNAKASFEEVVYGEQSYRDLSGNLKMENNRLSFDAMKGNFLDGKIAFSGFYEAYTTEYADSQIKLSIQSAGLSKVTSALSVMNRFAPILRSASGMMNMDLSIQSRLGKDLSPQWEKLFAMGNIQALNARVQSPVLGQLSSTLKQGDWSTFSASNVIAKFSISQGNLLLQPINLKIGPQEGRISGSVSLLGLLKIDGSTQLKANQLTKLFGENSTLSANLASKDLNIPFQIGGSVTKPELKVDMGGVKKTYTDLIQNKLNEQKEEALKKAREEAARIRAEAASRIAQLELELSSQIQKLMSLRDQKVEQLMSAAGSNPLKKSAARLAADKVRSSSDKEIEALKKSIGAKINQIQEEADQKATEVTDKAQN